MSNKLEIRGPNQITTNRQALTRNTATRDITDDEKIKLSRGHIADEQIKISTLEKIDNTRYKQVWWWVQNRPKQLISCEKHLHTKLK